MAKRTTKSISPILQHESHLMWVVLLAAIIIVVLHSYGAFAPSGDNWGFHQLAFLPLVLRIIVLVLMASILLPSVQKKILWAVYISTERWRQLPRFSRRIFPAVMFVLSGLLFWFLREGTTFLGDGQIFIHSLPYIGQVESIHIAYEHEPLVGYIVWKLYQVLPSQEPVAMARTAFQLVSIVSGLGFLVLVLFFVRELSRQPVVRVLAYLSIIVLGTTQLFFGYVETYSPAFVALFAYLMLALLYVRWKVPLVIPCAVFGCSFVLYFGSLVFFPTVLILFWLSAKRRERLAILLALAAMIAVVVLFLWLCDYPLNALLALFGSESHLIPMTGLMSGWQGYTLFSVPHFLDVVNFQLLVAPFAFVVFVGIVAVMFRTIPWRDSEWIVLFTAGLCATGIMSVFNCDIGMSRDWDLLSTFSPGLIVAGTYALVRFLQAGEHVRRIFTIIIVVTGLHSVAWIGVNADDQRAMNRFGVLMQNSLWGHNAFKVHEELARYCREHGDPRGEIEHYKQYLLVDSTNARVLGNVGGWYWNLGDVEHGVPYFERAVAAGSLNVQDYLILGDYYGKNGRFSEALTMTKKALAIDPNQPQAVFNAAVFALRSGGTCEEALMYYRTAIRLNPNSPPVYLDAGNCYEQIGQRDSMVQCLSNYLRLAPDGPDAEYVRKKLAAIEK